MSLTPSEPTPALTRSRAKGKNTSVTNPDILISPVVEQIEASQQGAHVSISHLSKKLAVYLSPNELASVREAYRFSDEMHLGQMRRSGEPYI